jgi:DNA-binding SARP family transcriptional activator
MVREHLDVTPSSLSIRLFGSFELRLHGDALPDACPRKGRSLIALLVLRNESGYERDEMARKLWPAAEDLESARHSLRQMLTRLRDALRPEAERLQSTAGGRVLRLDLRGAEVDLIAFDQAIRRGDAASLGQAVGLYRGALLEGWPDELFGRERAARRQEHLKALYGLAADALSRSERAVAARFLALAVTEDPDDQRAPCALIEALRDRGEADDARWVYQEFRSLLRRGRKDAEPGARMRALFNGVGFSHRILCVPSPRLCGERTVPSCASPDGLPGLAAGAPVGRLSPLRAAPESGPLPPDSPFYVPRPADHRFLTAIARHDGIIRVKGARQMGKSSLLARGLKQAREAGDQVVLVDFRRFNAADLENAEILYVRLAARLAEQLGLETHLDDVWSHRLGPNDNFERYLRRDVLSQIAAPLILATDAVGLLDACPFRGEVFGLFRSLCEERQLCQDDLLGRLTLVMAYATEPRLPDISQSPFNVGTEVILSDFGIEQVAELNRRYSSPLKGEEEVVRYAGLMGGQPYLVHRGLREMAETGGDLGAFEAAVEWDGGVFASHLRSILGLLIATPAWGDAVREVLQNRPCRDAASFIHLRDASVLVGTSAREARLRCPLYASYLSKHLL